MCDYEVLHYGKPTGMILEALCRTDAMKQITLTGLQDRGDNYNLEEI